MAIIWKLVCDSCGLEIEKEGLKFFWLDFSGELRISRQTRITMRNFYDNTLLRGFLSKRYCSHCRNQVYTYRLDNCGEGYDMKRACNLLKLLIKGYKVNPVGLRDHLYGGEGFFLKPKDGLDMKKDKESFDVIGLTDYDLTLDGRKIDKDTCPNCGGGIDFLTDGSPCPRCSCNLRRIRRKFLD